MLGYLDCNVCVGKRGTKHPLEIWKTEDILSALNRCGIAGALIYSGWAKDYAPTYGNRRLIEELKKSDRLFGCYTITSNQMGNFLTGEEIVSDMRESNMKAARMFPTTHMYIPDERTMGDAFSALEAAEYPLFVDAKEITMPQLEVILKRYSKLNVVLTG